jgi:[ribosomal protein S5]-alanine N-acetyltransferase
VRFGFEEMGLHRIQAEIDPQNTRSRRLVEALGLAYEGTLRGNHQVNGRYFDDAIYARVGG